MPHEIKDLLAEQFRKTKVILMGFSEFPEDPKIEYLPSVKNNLKSLRECFLNPEIMGIPEENVLVIDENSRINILATLNSQLEDYEDTVIVYYAGHGYIRKDGQFCLATQETKTKDLNFTAIDFQDIRDILSRSSARTKILILDCCFSGRALKDFTTMSDALSAITAQVSEIEGAYIIASAPPNQPAFASDKDKPTIFSGELIGVLETGIDNKLPHINIDELFETIYKRLTRKARPEPQRLVVQHAGKYPFARNRKYPLSLPEELDISFQNREYELNLIEQTLEDIGNDPYIYIFEPAQTGKTYLLNQLEKKYSRLDKWEVIYIRLDETALEWEEAKLFRLFAERLEAIIAQVGEKSGDAREISIDDLCEIVNRIYLNYHKRMLFLIDNIEFLNDTLALSLGELLKALKDYFKEITPNYQPGFVFAGRRSFTVFERGLSPNIRRVELSPLIPKVVVILLKEVSKKLRKKPGRKTISPLFSTEWYQSRAEEIIHCSSGHPGCMAALIRHFYRKEFGITNLNSNQVFREIISPIIKDEILKYEKLIGTRTEKLPPSNFQQLIKVLLELSLYRIIILSHIEEAARRLKLTLSPNELNELEYEVNHCLVIQLDENRIVHWMHRTVRQLLFRHRTLGKKVFQLHANAAEYYQKLIEDARYAVSSNAQITFVVEILYHLAQSREIADIALFNLVKVRLEKLSARLPAEFSTGSAQSALLKRLVNDEELRQTINARFGPHAYTELLSVLKKKRGNPGGNV